MIFANWVLVVGSIASKVFFNSNSGLTVAPVVTLGPKATNPVLGKVLDPPIKHQAKPCRIQRRGRAKSRKGSTISLTSSKSTETRISVRRNNESPSSSVTGSRQSKKDVTMYAKRQVASVIDESEQKTDSTVANQEAYNEPLPLSLPLC